MEFRTTTAFYDLGERISLAGRGFSIGSCFAENIAGKLAASGFRICSNPFGVLYNPASIAGAFEILAGSREFTAADLIPNGDIWCSPLFHGSFSGTNPEAVAEGMNRAIDQGRRALGEADYVLISFGTPTVYTVSDEFASVQKSLPAGEVVANCHKFPARYYRQRRMDIEEIASLFSGLSGSVLRGKKVIYTVSPVRYLKEGLHGSNLGKSILQLAVERICQNNADSYYFPAYEILTDELRDYRFYGEDMVHPSPVAVDYIWSGFRSHALTEEAAAAAAEIEKLSVAANHRVQSPGGAEHKKFLRSMAAKAEALAKKYPDADLSKLTAYFTSCHPECNEGTLNRKPANSIAEILHYVQDDNKD